jgi:hypothetical protein
MSYVYRIHYDNNTNACIRPARTLLSYVGMSNNKIATFARAIHDYATGVSKMAHVLSEQQLTYTIQDYTEIERQTDHAADVIHQQQAHEYARAHTCTHKHAYTDSNAWLQ